MPTGGDYAAAEVNAVLALVAPDYVPIPSGDPIATALRVIAERLAGMTGYKPNGDQIGITFDQLVASLGYIPSSGDERDAAIKLLFQKYPNPMLGVLISAINSQPLTSAINGATLTSARTS